MIDASIRREPENIFCPVIRIFLPPAIILLSGVKFNIAFNIKME
jgi:hypothetical protein